MKNEICLWWCVDFTQGQLSQWVSYHCTLPQVKKTKYHFFLNEKEERVNKSWGYI